MQQKKTRLGYNLSLEPTSLMLLHDAQATFWRSFCDGWAHSPHARLANILIWEQIHGARRKDGWQTSSFKYTTRLLSLASDPAEQQRT